MSDRSEANRRAGRIGGLRSQASLTPEQRSARASLAGKRSAEVRARKREEAEARGETVATPKRNSTQNPLPPIEELEDETRAIVEGAKAGKWPLPATYGALIREAALRRRIAVAEATHAALKAERGQP